MTLGDIERAILGIGAAAVAGLVAVVRGADMQRIAALEAAHKELRTDSEAARERLLTEIHMLREDVSRKHEQLVGLITARLS